MCFQKEKEEEKKRMIDDDFTPIYMKCYKIMLECTVFNPHLNYKHRKKRKSVLSTQI